MMTEFQYQIVLSPLSEDMGGGYVAFVPDLQGCMSDGETPEQALEQLADAVSCWIETQEEQGEEVPAPGTSQQLAREEATRQNAYLQRQDELIEKQQELIEALRDRCRELEANRGTAVAGWRQPVMFENPATSGRKGTLKVPDAPKGEVEILPFTRD